VAVAEEALTGERAWEEIAPLMFDDGRWEAAGTEVELALRLLEVDPPAAILDLACGPGRHLLELARRGYRATGVDSTAAFLGIAESLAAGEGLELELVQEDMREFRREDGFDGALSMATSFGYFHDPDDDLRVLVNVHDSLRPGAPLVLELMGKEVVARTLAGRDWREEDGLLLLTEQRVRDDWTWVDNRLVLLRTDGDGDGDARQEFVLSHRLYSAAELVSLLDRAGFSSVSLYGGLAGTPYDETAERLVAVARAS
jgi:SAM-dependent methyltransferase